MVDRSLGIDTQYCSGLLASHGVRTVDNLQLHCGITDPDELEVRNPPPLDEFFYEYLMNIL